MQGVDEPVRWGILGTANIAQSAFLPAAREAGGGAAIAVAGRDPDRTKAWAAEQGIERTVDGYESLVDDSEVEAIYIPLPNGLHAEWTIAALESGKSVLCEKPMCGTPEETERVLAVARANAGMLWEAFVFPFHPQIDRVRELIADGAVGQIREIDSSFHFALDDPGNIRLSAELAGGSVQDVGCYPVRLARLLFDDEPELEHAIAGAVWSESGVDEELWGSLRFPRDRRLVFSGGFRLAYDTFTRVLGTEGEIRITNPFHPVPGDELIVVRDEEIANEPAPGASERSFTAAIRHMHRALRGLEDPLHLAIDEAMGNATAIAALLSAARS